MEICIYSYNIHSGRNIFFRKSLQNMIDYFLKNPPDILAVQEVHDNPKHGHQFQIIRDSLSMFGSFGGNLRIGTGYYGNAIFSKFPIELEKNIALPGHAEPRGVLQCMINIHSQAFTILNTHLGLSKNERRQQIQMLSSLVSSLSGPILLAGDLNTTESPIFPKLDDAAKKLGKDSISTVFPLNRRIDYMYATSKVHLVSYEVVKIPYSDHYPLKAVLRFS
ncbi:endonuclease/exonuclease/phosphatase family metal-dependent hydrolase [Ammoniphilus resinae]|uniref:Endonuclease/exonuclease/phosphatase family metal-dependent hydrolase n=1 Tax=Ammoniphilus resinae TaxID=861532 RepID=A0ABS4GUL5_9BACL|nr:endonuclease/exonuclease/phosphatase family protein [Ammoniphilus resinae]MBP1933953.1 endonuclease/exonuclease/phosphatase family metal-dependent hydrolase [Ammoniphilus resinae]